MKNRLLLKSFPAWLLLVLSFPVGSFAETPMPFIPKGLGEKCVEPTEDMLINHMDYILHQRDETVYDGIRTKKHSLAECINCHVQPDENGDIARIDSNKHFCNSCHEYVSVQIDCFECHADRPQKFINRNAKNATIKKQLQEKITALNLKNENLK